VQWANNTSGGLAFGQPLTPTLGSENRMTTFSELHDSREQAHLPRVAKGDYRLLRHCDYWDGAKSGVLIYENKKCWFQVFAEYDGQD
jgi:hypothetical protein